MKNLPDSGLTPTIYQSLAHQTLSDCGFDLRLGFIRPEKEDTKNPQWRALAEEVKFILSSEMEPTEKRKEIETRIAALPEYDVGPIGRYTEDHIFSLRDLAFITNALIHCAPRVDGDNKVPDKLGIPFKTLSNIVGIPAVMSYPLYIQYNAREVEATSDLDRAMQNPFTAANTFSTPHAAAASGGNAKTEVLLKRTVADNPHHDHEAHFVRIHQAIELAAAPLVTKIVELASIPADQLANQRELIALTMRNCAQQVKEMRSNFSMMYFGTGVEAFNQFRHQLKGTVDLKTADGAAEGLFSENGTAISRHVGGSGAQTPIFPIFDALTKRPEDISKTAKDFAAEQSEFFLPRTKNLINFVGAKGASFRDFVTKDPECCAAFNDMVHDMNHYRMAHMNMVTHYIGIQTGTGGTSAPAQTLRAMMTKQLAEETAVKARL